MKNKSQSSNQVMGLLHVSFEKSAAYVMQLSKYVTELIKQLPISFENKAVILKMTFVFHTVYVCLLPPHQKPCILLCHQAY